MIDDPPQSPKAARTSVSSTDIKPALKKPALPSDRKLKSPMKPQPAKQKGDHRLLRLVGVGREEERASSLIPLPGKWSRCRRWIQRDKVFLWFRRKE